jgi:hypothetical protein
MSIHRLLPHLVIPMSSHQYFLYQSTFLFSYAFHRLFLSIHSIHPLRLPALPFSFPIHSFHRLPINIFYFNPPSFLAMNSILFPSIIFFFFLSLHPFLPSPFPCISFLFPFPVTFFVSTPLLSSFPFCSCLLLFSFTCFFIIHPFVKANFRPFKKICCNYRGLKGRVLALIDILPSLVGAEGFWGRDLHRDDSTGRQGCSATGK